MKSEGARQMLDCRDVEISKNRPFLRVKVLEEWSVLPKEGGSRVTVRQRLPMCLLPSNRLVDPSFANRVVSEFSFCQYRNREPGCTLRGLHLHSIVETVLLELCRVEE